MSNIVEKLRNSIAEKLRPTAHLKKEKSEWEQQIIDAQNGEFEDNEQAIVDAKEALKEINQTLGRRQKYQKS